MNSNNIDTLLKFAAPAAKPVSANSARDDAQQFDSYLRQAAKSTTASEPASNRPPTARPAKKESESVSTGEQGATASSEDETVPTEMTEQDEVGVEETTDVAESDEVLISTAAAAIVAEPEIVAGEISVEPATETSIAGQTEESVEESTPPTDQTVPKDAAQTDFVELLPVAETAIVEESAVTADAANIPGEQTSTPTVDEDAAVIDQKSGAGKSASAIAATPPASATSGKRSDDRSESESSEQDSQDAGASEAPQEIPQPATSELPDLVPDADKSAGSNEKASNATSPASTAQPHFGNQTATQSAGGISASTESHSTRAEGESQTPTIDRARFVQRVTNAFRAAQQNDGHIQLRLSPPELGQLRIEIAVRNGVLSANLETETADARRVLLDNLPALRQRLAEQDIRIDKFEVDIRREGGQSEGQAGAQDRQTEQQSQRASAQNRIRTTQASEIITTRVPRTQALSADAGLDVRI